MNTLARLIAYYLPQFHPIPENDEWWGKGFTEWTNTAKAKPLFPGHYQPHIPTDLGFYDLRVPEARAAQAELARTYGIEAFCYYHYWFAGRRLLERPFNEVLKSGEPDFPFCLCWANETWTGRWHGNPGRILIEQTYPGTKDDINHFYCLLDAFADRRYMRVDGRPVFIVYNPDQLPNPRKTTDCWRELASRAGLKGLYLIGAANKPWSASKNGFDAATTRKMFHRKALGEMKGLRKVKRLIRKFQGYPVDIYSYKKILPHLFMAEASMPDVHPCVIPNWDNTPRCGMEGLAFYGSTPELFRKHLRATLEQVSLKPFEKRLVFVKSWNEWAEGNHLEPDLKFGKAYLEIIREEVCAKPASRHTDRTYERYPTAKEQEKAYTP
ncbi:MAG TPA: glycoside hydrolase family 99-like domain-containing protein [Dissulfurispiraceae bacterium]